MAIVSASTDIATAQVPEVRAALEDAVPRRPGETNQQYLDRYWRRHLRLLVLRRRQTEQQAVAITQFETDYGPED